MQLINIQSWSIPVIQYSLSWLICNNVVTEGIKKLMFVVKQVGVSNSEGK